MILAIDIGNTNIKFTGIANGCPRGQTEPCAEDISILFEERLPTEAGRETGQFLQQALALLAGHAIFPLPEETLDAVAISSVVPADTPAAVSLAEKICRQAPVLISCRSDSGLSFEKIPSPERVGTDRIADAAWAAARYSLPAMTVDLGTATTINVVAPVQADERSVQREREDLAPLLRPGLTGLFLGGMIGAGVKTSLHALRTGTAQLPELEPCAVAQENLIGIDTDSCMLSSAIVGTAAMIEGLAARVEEKQGSPVTLILTGGNARYVSPWIRRPFVYEDSLASKGTAVIAMRELYFNRRS